MTSADELSAQVQQAESEGKLSSAASERIRQWLFEPPFEPYRPMLIAEIRAGQWTTLDNAFYAVLEFGTGGRRGRMHPVGTNVLNDRTIGESARGLADYIISRKGTDAPRSCVIARDTRHNSARFAEQCARVLAAAGFKVYLFPEPRSTPLLSYAVRRLRCDGGIMITASHNPPSDNGFKCYAAAGGQVIPPDDSGIIACVDRASHLIIPEARIDDPAIELVGEEIDEGYLSAVVGESVCGARDLKIVYTPMHGVGETSVAAALIRAGFRYVNILASQRTPDGNFPNVPGHVSNPEIPKTLGLAIEEAKKTGADLVLASDPDADRIGAATAVTGDPRGEWTTFDGNQIGILLAAFVMEKTRDAGEPRPEHYLVTTLVTSRMARALAERHGVGVEDDLLVGFKWIAQRIDQRGPENFLYGFEESHGYVKGTYVRDKDAAVGSLLFAEMTADLKAQGRTVVEYLDDLYAEVGHYGDRLINKTLEGREGAMRIKTLMAAFRDRPPRSIAGLDVVEVHDYKTHEIRSVRDSEPPRPLPDPSGDLLIFHLDQPEVRFAARPSGTEPKIKFYLFARSEVADRQSLPEAKRRTSELLDRMAADIEAYIRSALAS